MIAILVAVAFGVLVGALGSFALVAHYVISTIEGVARRR